MVLSCSRRASCDVWRAFAVVQSASLANVSRCSGIDCFVRYAGRTRQYNREIRSVSIKGAFIKRIRAFVRPLPHHQA